MKLTKEEFAKWREWMSHIEREVMWLLEFRRIYETFETIVVRNVAHIEAHEGGHWCLFVRRSYGDHAAMAVRRHLKCDKDSISLGRLLDQMKTCAIQFTYDRFLEFFPVENPENEWQRSTFDRFSDDGRTMSDARIARDIDELKRICCRIEEFADKRIAHLDRRDVASAPNATDLNNAIDLFDSLVCKYRVLLTGANMTTVEAYNPFEWQRIFRVPLDVSSAGSNPFHPSV